MALTDNRTQLNDCQDDTQTFATSGGALGTNTLAGNTLITPNSVQAKHSNAYEDTYTTGDSAGSTFSLDLSDSTVYIAIKDNGYDLSTVVGAGIVLGDGTDRIAYSAGGSDALGMPYQKVFNIFKLDGSDAAANPGTADVDHHVFAGTEANLSFTAVTTVGYGGIHNAKAQGNVANVFISGIYYISNASYAATITGGTAATPETMADLVGDDETVGAGLFSNPIGSQYYIFSPTEWGDSGATESAFEGTDEQWFYLGDNGGGRAIGAGNFFHRLVGGTGTNRFLQTRVTNVNVGTRCTFDMSNTSFNILTLEATTWIDFGAITLPVQSAGNRDVNNSTFVNCDQMDLQSCDMDGNTWNGSNNANGAIKWDENTSDVQNQDNSTFIRVGTHNAIEINPTGAGPFTYNISGYVFDSFASQDDAQATAAEKVFYINPATLSADININLTDCQAINIGAGNADDTGTDGFSYREVASYTGTVTITQTVTLTVTVQDAGDGSLLEDVLVSIRNASTNALVSQGRTNASGVYTDSTYNYTGDLSVNIETRKSSPGDTRYLPKIDGATILNTGMTATVQLTEDTNAGIIESTRFDVSRHGQVSNDVSGTGLTARIRLPGGTNRKLVVGCGYWDSTVDRAISTLTYDGNAMTGIVTTNSVTEGSNIHEMFLYRYDIPDADSGVKDVVMTLDGAAPVRFMGFAIINLAATGAQEDSGTSSAQSVTSNPSITLNNTSQPAIDIMFAVTDDLDTFPPTASGVGSIRRSDKLVNGLLQLTFVRADRTATGSHSLGATYDASSKTYVSAAATFPD